MKQLERLGGELLLGRASLTELADKYGTPLYVYSRTALENNWRAFDAAFKETRHLVCFAVKSCSNISVLALLAKIGSGFDIVSAGELARVAAASAAMDKVVFSGVGKSAAEIEAALDCGVACFNVESAAEFDLLETIAAQKSKKAPLAVRIKPDIDAGAHTHISTGSREHKFGVSRPEAKVLLRRARESANLDAKGISCHIGSQIIDLSIFQEVFKRVVAFADEISADGAPLSHIDFGGGLGICYVDEEPPSPERFVKEILRSASQRPYDIFIEPGRAIAGDAGLLLTRVLRLKEEKTRNFAIVDAAMSEFMRPALYGAEHKVASVHECPQSETKRWDVVGPVCESADVLAWQQNLALRGDDLLAILATGAYGFTLSSNYNARPKVAEVLIDDGKDFLVRKRETIGELVAAESECEYWQNITQDKVG